MNLDELYFKDNFTKEEDKTNLEVNKLTIECLESKNKTFKLDELGNLKVNSISVNNGNTQVDLIYPIGSIYMNTTSANPNTLFGGTWEQIKDRFLLACGNLFPNGAIGGEMNHTLTIAEIPRHHHNLGVLMNGQIGNGCNSVGGTNAQIWPDDIIADAGGNHSHNNMPPYLTVYIWKRVA